MLKNVIKNISNTVANATWEEGKEKRSSSRIMMLVGGFFVGFFMLTWFGIVVGIGLASLEVIPATWTWSKFASAMQWGLTAVFSTMLPYLFNIIRKTIKRQ